MNIFFDSRGVVLELTHDETQQAATASDGLAGLLAVHAAAFVALPWVAGVMAGFAAQIQVNKAWMAAEDQAGGNRGVDCIWNLGALAFGLWDKIIFTPAVGYVSQGLPAALTSASTGSTKTSHGGNVKSGSHGDGDGPRDPLGHYVK